MPSGNAGFDRIRSSAGPGITLGCDCICTRAMSSVSSRQPAACSASASVVLPCLPGAATITARPFRSMAAACRERSPWRVKVTIDGTPQRCISRRKGSVPTGTSIVRSNGAIRYQPTFSAQKSKIWPPP